MAEIFPRINIGPSSPENDELIAHAGRIPQRNFEISAGVLFGLAIVAVISRTVKRLLAFGSLKLDDAFLWFGLLCLAAATTCLYKALYVTMLSLAITTDPRVIVPIDDIHKLLAPTTIFDVFICTIWTCTFAVKASFLTLFWGLIQGVSKHFNIYFWLVVIYTLIIWLFVVVEPFILCPHSGQDAAKCPPEKNYFKAVFIYTFSAALDIVSDIMIASIPILILRKTRMKQTQKLSLGIFLCLSLIMAIIALIRACGIKIGHIIDISWTMYWQYIEGCVACIMVSVVPFSTLFVTVGRRPSGKKRKGPSSSLIYFWKKRKNSPGNENCVEVSSGAFKLPKPPNAILSGMRTFIRRNNRDGSRDSTTFDSTALVSKSFGTMFMETEQEYQQYLRQTADSGESEGHLQHASQKQSTDNIV